MNLVYAMGIGFLLDCVLGDPHVLPHPVRWMGRLILFLENRLHGKRTGPESDAEQGRYGQERTCAMESEEKTAGQKRREILCGMVLVLAVLTVTGICVWTLRRLAYSLSVVGGILTDGVLFYYSVAPRSLYRESMAVYAALSQGSLQKARRALSMIVGRDTDCLGEEGVIRAAVETVAENTSDGVTAPLFYMALGGPVLCYLYKAVNTMDSMVGYHNDTYEYFGKAAAITDDVWNYVPSRMTAYVMLPVAAVLMKGKGMFGRLSCKLHPFFFIPKNKKTEYSDDSGDFNCVNFSNNSESISLKNAIFYPYTDIKRVLFVYKRDRRKHKSPNSAQTESICAGMLGIRLAGDASYFGKVVHKPCIGDDLRPPLREDIKRANALMYGTAVLRLALLMAGRMAVYL